MDADGGNAAQVSDVADAGRPDWSPDGTQLVLRGIDGLYVVPSAGGKTRLLKQESGAGDIPTAWGPDGIRIAYCGSADGAGLYVTNDSGKGAVRLTPAGFIGPNGPPVTPAWAPDGEMIAIGGEWDQPNDIYLMYADGSGLTQLTHDGKAGAPDWAAGH